jgi:hypothetical protein
MLYALNKCGMLFLDRDKGIFPMETFTANKISEMLERDRATMLRALNNTPPDAVVRGRSQWKISTAAASMSAHLQRGGSGNGRTLGANNVDPRLQDQYDAFEQADSAMRQLKTVEARRKAVIAMRPQIAKMHELQRRLSVTGNHNNEPSDLKADHLFMLYLRGFERPCEWSMAEVWANVDCRG